GDQAQALKDRNRELRRKGYNQDERAKMLGLPPRTITRWSREVGTPERHLRPSFRCELYHDRIIELKDAELGDREVAARLKDERKHPDEKTPTHSGIGYYLKKINYQRARRGPGVDARAWEPLMRILAAAEMSKEEIARAVHKLGGPSPSGTKGHIKSIGL